jgi:inosose dehydratase
MTEPKIAGAPISWGVCEVPGWGPMLPAPRVLRELRSLGLSAIELGAPGFLPSTAPEVRAVLDAFGVELLGGFVPLVLHDSAVRADTLAQARAAAEFFRAAGGTRFVTAVVVDADWSPRVSLDAAGWSTMFEMLDEIDQICSDNGVVQVLHPHVNTLVETAGEVTRVLDHSQVKWCLDTGHLAIGGTDPVKFARDHAARVAHVHLKDVDLAIASALNAGHHTLMGATQAGMFRSLGEGDIDIAACVTALRTNGFDEWFVLEQDISLGDEPPAEGQGPVDDVRTSLRFLRGCLGLNNG